jgi:hypothetical protein
MKEATFSIAYEWFFHCNSKCREQSNAREECMMASNVFYQVHDSSTANSGAHSAIGTTDLCGVLQSLVQDMLAVYVKAEKVHWHLRLHREVEGRLAATDGLAHVSDELCASVLNAILQLGRSVQNHSSGEDVHFAQLINAVAASHTTTETLP